MAEVVYAKERGKERKEKLVVNLEEFISVKGISALGNQLTKEKINQINLLDPIPYEAPEEVPADEIEVVDEEIITEKKADSKDKKDSKPTNGEAPPDLEIDDEGQITLF